jgi:hypothetical protein
MSRIYIPRRNLIAVTSPPLGMALSLSELYQFCLCLLMQSTALFGFRSLVGGITAVGNRSVVISPAYYVVEGDELAALKPLK